MNQPVKIAYLEISARQSAKTTRLAEFGKAVVAQGKQAILVCNPPLAAYFRKQFPWMTVVGNEKHLVNISPENAVWFYDDFDFLKSVVIRPGAYYATTARYLRVAGEPVAENDVLMQLLDANGYRHERYLMPSWLSNYGEHLRNCRLELSPSQFRLSMLGEFLT
ncbi:hypothetical protein G7013_06385 [Pseudomonas viridiflava]|uniref:hypothetical protein n=1 Tax=Pseudomonas viridiflava TaxID=33069 RepID=UPI0015E3AD69|nr:hypothetical protein [Pseudomonas viridiflava]MBA1229272.1 hypothetical protein [Pseudomonas viridiflava]